MAEQGDFMIAGKPAYQYGSRDEARKRFMEQSSQAAFESAFSDQGMNVDPQEVQKGLESRFGSMWSKFQAAEARRKARLTAQKAAMKGRGAAVQRRAFFEEDQGDMGMTTGG